MKSSLFLAGGTLTGTLQYSKFMDFLELYFYSYTCLYFELKYR